LGSAAELSTGVREVVTFELLGERFVSRLIEEPEAGFSHRWMGVERSARCDERDARCFVQRVTVCAG
jgi:hypothetical protein